MTRIRLKYRKSLKKGFIFQNPEVLRRARNAVKTKVTCASKLGRRALIRTENDDCIEFVLDDINRADVKENLFTLGKSFNDIQIIHECYIYYRLPLENPEAEADSLSNEKDYITKIYEKVNDTTRLFRRYKKVVKEQSKLEESRCREEARLMNSNTKKNPGLPKIKGYI